ncbi:hypothetical protein [Micromonospora sp. IBHARD004]|uniref:hypothetical protein n=1 Tax=Micromonospora sp. IBHARD004 TaxID=3457764 RepID=UPI00405974BC
MPTTTPKRYRITGACVQVKTDALAGMLASHVRSGHCVVTLYRDSLLPIDAPADQVEHLLQSGLIEEVPANV